jgi:hypothetical protein
MPIPLMHRAGLIRSPRASTIPPTARPERGILKRAVHAMAQTTGASALFRLLRNDSESNGLELSSDL